MEDDLAVKDSSTWSSEQAVETLERGAVWCLSIVAAGCCCIMIGVLGLY